MSLSIIGCVVNGPGEARETDLGFTGGGAGKGHGQIISTASWPIDSTIKDIETTSSSFARKRLPRSRPPS